jgi:hypothetical protein
VTYGPAEVNLQIAMKSRGKIKSPIGTNAKCCHVRFAAAFGGSADIARKSSNRRHDPTPTSITTARHSVHKHWGLARHGPNVLVSGAPDLMPLWTSLDATPEGRGTNWYPKLEYGG